MRWGRAKHIYPPLRISFMETAEDAVREQAIREAIEKKLDTVIDGKVIEI